MFHFIFVCNAQC